ncbi:hypothetical protein Acid7E03_41380 [Acidisoma sp. 7E03]
MPNIETEAMASWQIDNRIGVHFIKQSRKFVHLVNVRDRIAPGAIWVAEDSGRIRKGSGRSNVWGRIGGGTESGKPTRSHDRIAVEENNIQSCSGCLSKCDICRRREPSIPFFMAKLDEILLSHALKVAHDTRVG